ncbi:FtsK/SpoIIIE family DNA translocase [Henriciella marina]|uniref:FtsK/SpoIIIE family DNA translocase n=1 Tax=Henriciella marina TaxID=453851 RepID=UPI00037E8E80|nr:DNA translocase FtsK [Henriciella marina]
MATTTAETPSAANREVSDPAWRILTGTAAFALGVLICGSVGTHQPTDPSLNAATALEVSNLFGNTGAILADLALQTFGFAAWMAGLCLMIGGAMRAVLIGAPRIRRWMFGAAFIPVLAAMLSAFPVPASWPFWTGMGGLVGDSLFSLVVVPFKALLLPAPAFLAGLALGIGAFLLGAAALGFRRGDAGLIQSAASSSGRRAMGRVGSAANGIGRLFGGLFSGRRSGQEEPEAYGHDDRMADLGAAPQFDDEDGYEEEEDDLPLAVTKPKVSQRQAPQPAEPITTKSGKRKRASRLPALDLLGVPPGRRSSIDEDSLLTKANRLAEVLREFGVRGRIKEVRPGPVVTLFELEPAAGVKSARVISLADDIARSMSAVSARVAVIPGKNAIGIELPNDERETVYLRSLLSASAYANNKSPLPMALGEDIGGTPTVVDLSKMPHLLIAGTTGSGKSVGVNAMILSLIYRLTPEQCRFIMIDPKMLELSIYEGIPHLLAPVVTDPKKAVNALQWTVREMEGRYELMSKAGVRNLAGFNEKAARYREKGEQLTRKVQTGYDERGKPAYETEILSIEHIPNIVVVIDEMADLMMVAGKEIEGCIQRLAQMARAAGIHLITATQRPSVDVITGTIKANFPTRISYMVTTKIDSRTILGEQGAEQLLGMGDLLYQAAGVKTKRLHGPFVSDEEVETVVGWLKEQGEPDYNENILEEPDEGGTGSAIMDAMLGVSTGDGDDDLYAQAMAIVIRDKRASTSYIQRRLKIGYNKAATLIERLEEEGVISAPNHAGKREILARDTPSD